MLPFRFSRLDSVRRFAMFALILFVSGLCYAENRTVTLTVEDEQHEPVIGAAVSLVAAADSTMVDAKITDSRGACNVSL